MPSAKTYVVCWERPEAGDLSGLLPDSVEQISLGFRARFAPYHVWKLARLLRALSIDVVHTHSYSPNLYGGLAATLAGVPAVVTSEHGTNPWKTRAHHWVERAVISRFADMRICVSKEILQIRQDIDRVPANKLIYIPNGTEIDANPTSPPPGRFVFGTLGRLVAQKDYGTLIKAMASCATAGGRQSSISSETVRNGEPGVRDSRSRTGIAIHITGMQSDTRAWLIRFHAFVMSSIREGQPMALLEAMSCGLPIVATRVGAIPETIASGSEGLLVEPGDPEGLARAMETLLSDEKKRKELGANALRRCRNEFSIQASCDRNSSVYRAVLDDSMRVG